MSDGVPSLDPRIVEVDWCVPDWRKPCEYERFGKASFDELRWELLRRHPGYRSDFLSGVGAAGPGNPTGTWPMQVARPDALERYGLRAIQDPRRAYDPVIIRFADGLSTLMMPAWRPSSLTPPVLDAISDPIEFKEALTAAGMNEVKRAVLDLSPILEFYADACSRGMLVARIQPALPLDEQISAIRTGLAEFAQEHHAIPLRRGQWAPPEAHPGPGRRRPDLLSSVRFHRTKIPLCLPLLDARPLPRSLPWTERASWEGIRKQLDGEGGVPMDLRTIESIRKAHESAIEIVAKFAADL